MEADKLKKVRAKRGKSVRARGLQFERDVANALKRVGFSDAKRHLEFQASECRGVDLSNTGQFAIQCKAKNGTPNIPAVFGEIKCSDEEIPVVAFKVVGKGEYACFKLSDAVILMGWIERFSKEGGVCGE